MCKTSSKKGSETLIVKQRLASAQPPPPPLPVAQPLEQISMSQQPQQQQQQLTALVSAAISERARYGETKVAEPVKADLESESEDDDDEQEKAGVKPACVNCRRSKVRCEGGIPCARCLRLTIENSCKRCEPKKRGRKRKIRPTTEETQLLEVLFEQARQVKPVDVTTLLPARTPESLEKDEIERFAALTGQFRSWRDQLTTDPNVTHADLTRFLWFCSYLSNIINAYIGQFPNTAQAQKLVSVWLCSNLADDVNRFVSSLGQDLVTFPNIEVDEDLQSAVERQVYKTMPSGVLSMTLYPRPFHPNNKPWVNPKLLQMLGYNKEELRVLMSQRMFFLRILHSSSYPTLCSSFWQTVARGKTSFTVKLNWVHRSGRVLETVNTFWLRYQSDLPVSMNCFIQPVPTANAIFSEEERVAPVAVSSKRPATEEGPVAAPVPPAPVGPLAVAANYSKSAFEFMTGPTVIALPGTQDSGEPQQLAFNNALKDDVFWNMSPISPSMTTANPSAVLDMVLNPVVEY